MEDQKDISKQGYKDDSPYKDRPYLDIHTPDGIIDMTGVSIPLLANNVILGPNSGLHKFDTTMVREIPMAQDGSEVKDYFTAYLNSDLFKRRAIDLHGEEEWEKVRDAKLNALNNTKVEWTDAERLVELRDLADNKENLNIFELQSMIKEGKSLQSKFSVGPNNPDGVIRLNQGEADLAEIDDNLSFNPMSSIIANEYSHALGSVPKELPMQTYPMTKEEKKLTNDRQSDFMWSETKLPMHDLRSYEVKSDIDTTRFELWKAGLYDFEEDFMFDESHMDYIRNNPDKFMKSDVLLEQYDNDDMLEMMNTFTSNDEMPIGMSKYGGSVKQSPYNKEKLALKNQDGVIADMMHNGAFLPKFQMGSEKKIETPQGNYTIKKDFDKGRNLPYVNYKHKDIDDRVYYDKDDADGSGNFQIIDIAQQIHDQQRAHELTKKLIKKYRNGDKLSPSGLKHLSALGMIPNEEVTDPNIEALTTPPPSAPEITFEDLDVNTNVKNVTLGDDKVIPIDDQIALYMAHVSGAAEGTPYQKKLKRIYDKLNRVYYQDSKKAGLDTVEYMKSLTKS
tara:strand:+ start:30600 stop:32285 length:1686 start_codon:yes stop_codon:yes gene_type:complete